MTVRSATTFLIAAATALAFLAQLLIDSSASNVVCACLAVVSTIAVLLYLQCTDAVDTQPMSSLVVFGFCVTTELAALLAQSADWTSLTANLRQPVSTFAMLTGYVLLAIIVHAVFKLFAASNTRHSAARRALEAAGVYAVPSVPQLWVMGVIGFCSYALVHIGDGNQAPGAVTSVALGFNFLACAPFLIPFYANTQGPGYCSKRAYQGLVIYAILLAGLAVARNVRSTMFLSAATIGCIYLLLCLRNRAPVRPGTAFKVAVIMLLIGTMASSIADLATAMTIARAARGKVSPLEMVSSTLQIWHQPHALEARRAQVQRAALYSAYDESYINSPIFARFAQTKFHDNAFYFASTLVSPESRQRLTDTTVQQLWEVLPTPVLKVLGVKVDKTGSNFSMGDYLAYLSRGVRLGARRTGSLFGQGQAVCGVLFPFVYALLCWAVFKWLDLLSVRIGPGNALPVPLMLMDAWQLFIFGIWAESVQNLVGFVVRGFVQLIVLYSLTFGIVRWITRTKPTRPAEVAAGASAPA